MVKPTRQAAYEIRYHFVWVPKYRRKVLVGDIPSRLTELLHDKVQGIGGETIDLAIQPVHIHLFEIFPPTLAPHQIRHRLKEDTAFMLRQEFPHLTSRLPTMWTCSYDVGTAGNVSAQTIWHYLERQEGR